MNQLQIEEKYSRKSVRQHILADIDMEHEAFMHCVDRVSSYLHGENYYASKQARVNKLIDSEELGLQEIVLELFAAILPAKYMSPIQAVTTQFGNRLGFENMLDGIKTAAEIIAVCEPVGFYDIYHAHHPHNNTDTMAIVCKFSLEQETLDLIAHAMYLPPMIRKPVDWTTNTNGGYLLGSGSVILGAMNHHEEEQCLDVINTIQGIAWELNETMLQIEETPNKDLDTQQKVDQFLIMAEQSRIVCEFMLDHGNKFYFVWKNDKRGRMYSQGYHINLQSTEYKKAVLQFNHKEVLT